MEFRNINGDRTFSPAVVLSHKAVFWLISTHQTIAFFWCRSVLKHSTAPTLRDRVGWLLPSFKLGVVGTWRSSSAESNPPRPDESGLCFCNACLIISCVPFTTPSERVKHAKVPTSALKQVACKQTETTKPHETISPDECAW
jgi:hypothetical protein